MYDVWCTYHMIYSMKVGWMNFRIYGFTNSEYKNKAKRKECERVLMQVDKSKIKFHKIFVLVILYGMCIY